MCRIAAWVGAPRALEEVIVRPAHSLLEQSQHAEEAKLSVNGDGFGFAWYDGDQPLPGLYRDVLPAWSDGNLPSLCRMIRAPLFLAHVRASTMGETARTNCHPFTFQNWSFCHNGQIPAFPNLRRKLEEALPDDLYAARRGSTDSEMLFLTLLANGLRSDPAVALRRTFDALRPGPGQAPNRATVIFSEGHSVFACRHASDNRAPTLYSQMDHNGGHVLASEPLDGNAENWTLLPTEQLITFSSGVAPTMVPLDQRQAA